MKLIFPAVFFAALSAGSASAQCPGGVCPTARATVRYVVQTPARVVAAVAPVTVWHPVPLVAPQPMPTTTKTVTTTTTTKTATLPMTAFTASVKPRVSVHRFAPLATFLRNHGPFGFFVQ